MPGSTFGTSTIQLEDVWARTEENRLKLLDVERSAQSAQAQLAELTTELQAGIRKLQSDFGRLRSESRFARAISNASPTPRSQMGRHSTTGASSPASSTALYGGVSTPDTSRVAYPSSYSSVPEKAAAVLSSSTVRLDALEAACEDLRLNVQDMASVPEATAQLVRGEMAAQMAQLKEELHAERNRTQHNTTSIIRVEAVTIEIKQALAELDRRAAAAQRDHSSELGAYRGELEAARERYEQTMQTSEALQASMQQCEQRCFAADELQASHAAELKQQVAELHSKLELEHAKGQQQMREIGQAQVQNYDLAQRVSSSERQLVELLERQRETLEQTVSVKGRIEAADGRMEEQASRADFVHSLLQEERRVRTAELEALRQQLVNAEKAVQQEPREGVQRRLDSLEDACRDMSHRISKCAQPQDERESIARRDLMDQKLQQLRADVELLKAEQSRQTEDTDRTSGEARQDHSGAALASQERLEELVAEALERQLCTALAPRSGLGEMPAAGAPSSHSPFSLLLGHLESREAARCGSLTLELASLRERLEGFERLRSARGHLAAAEASAEAAPAAESEGVAKLQAALADCSGDVASLAKEIAAVRVAHDTAFASLGGLPKLVADAAAVSVERTQESLAAEFAARKEELAQAAAAQHKALREQAESLAKETLASAGDAADLDSTRPRAGAERRPGGSSPPPRPAPGGLPEVRRVHAVLESCVGQLEALQQGYHDLHPRVQALETVIASRDCRASPAQPATPGLGSVGVPVGGAGAAGAGAGAAGAGGAGAAGASGTGEKEILKQVLASLGGLVREGAAAVEALDLGKAAPASPSTSLGPIPSSGPSSPPPGCRRPPLARSSSPGRGPLGAAEDRSLDLGSSLEARKVELTGSAVAPGARGYSWRQPAPPQPVEAHKGSHGSSREEAPALGVTIGCSGGGFAEHAAEDGAGSSGLRRSPAATPHDRLLRSPGLGSGSGSSSHAPLGAAAQAAASPPPAAASMLQGDGGSIVLPSPMSMIPGRSSATPLPRNQSGSITAPAWKVALAGAPGARCPAPAASRSPTSSITTSPKSDYFRQQRPISQVRGSSPDSSSVSSSAVGNKPVVRPTFKALGQR